MNVSNPQISVVMSVFNDAKWLRPSVESILKQTHSKFEFVIIDDGSSDETIEILEACAAMDQRIHLLKNPSNMGLSRSLNRGLEASRGRYIARHDADDIAYPERLEKQFVFMEARPEVGVLGTQYRKIAPDNTDLGPGRTPLTHNGIVWAAFWGLAFLHPSTLYRRTVVESVHGYNPEPQHIEDLYLWLRLLGRTQFANCAEVLMDYRVHPQSICRTHRQEQLDKMAQLKSEFVSEQFHLCAPRNVFRQLKSPGPTGPDISQEDFAPYLSFLMRLAQALEERKMLIPDSSPHPEDLVAQTSLLMARSLKLVDEKDLLVLCERYLPRWLFRFVRKYFRTSMRVRRCLPGPPVALRQKPKTGKETKQ